MYRTAVAVVFLFALLLPGTAGEKQLPPKIKALLSTGGGYHDYKALNPVLTKKIGELIHVSFEVKSGLDTLKNPKFADGFDVVVYNFCCANEKNNELIENALKVTRDGKPTMLIHCDMQAIAALLHVQTTALRGYWRDGDMDQAAQYHKARTAAWQGLSKVMGIDN